MYNEDVGSVNSESCKRCPFGMYSKEVGLSDVSSCIKCPMRKEESEADENYICPPK
jgi:hypothetical protein